MTEIMGTNGRTIIENALGVCSYIAPHPDPTKWFDNTGSSGSTDDRIDSSHSVEYDEVKPMTVIQEILEKASNPAGVKGFDMYETPSGVLVGHLRNSLDFVSPIASITPETYSKSEDVHRVQNKIKVYGAKTKMNPTDMDSWSDSLTNWSAVAGSISLDTDSVLGSNSIKVTNNDTYATMRRTNIGTIKASYPGREFFRRLRFEYKAQSNGNLESSFAELNIWLLAPDINNSFRFTKQSPGASGWIASPIDLGQKYEGAIDPPYWKKFGSADWNNIQGLQFGIDDPIATSVTLKVDKIFFSDAHFVGLAEDATSQSSYGVRMPEPFVDESLVSDAECGAKAAALLAFFKDPVVSLENVLVDGDHRFRPGDRLRVIVANDNLDAYFRITQIVDRIKGVTWDSILTLSNEPVLIENFLVAILKQRNIDARRN